MNKRTYCTIRAVCSFALVEFGRKVRTSYQSRSAKLGLCPFHQIHTMRTFAKFLTAVAGALAIFGLNMAWTDWNNLSAVSDKPETYYSSKELGWFDSVSALQIENFPHHYVVRFRMTLRAGSFTTTEEGLYSSEALLALKPGDKVLVYKVSGRVGDLYVIKDIRRFH